MALARIGWLNRHLNLQQNRTFIASAYEVLQQTDAVKQSELSNGVKVASYENGRPTAVIGVWVDNGSKDEVRGTSGTAKFFQHLLAKGTDKRSAKQLETDLSKLGARLSSHLDRDHTAYYVTCLTKDAEQVVEILADVLKNTKLNAADVEAERDTLLKQLENADEDYDQAVREMLHAAAFQGTGYENNPLGHSDAIKKISREQIAALAQSQFTPHRVVFTGVGGVAHDQVTEWANKHFGNLSGPQGGKVPSRTGVRFTGSEFIYRDDNIPYLYGALAVEGVPRGHHDELALK
ncbi:bc1 complex core subunit 1, partial [Aphelenchoides avenae]